MKAEERKHLQENELQNRLSSVWGALTSNSPTATRIWTIILIGLTVALCLVVYNRISPDTKSTIWTQLDFAVNAEELKKVAEEHPNTVPGRVARLHLARTQVADASTRVGAMTPEMRSAAADQLEAAKKVYVELSTQKNLPDVILQESLSQAGRIEEILAAVPKKEGSGMRGSLDEAVKYYESLRARFPESPAAVGAARRADEIKSKRAEIEKLYAELNQSTASPTANSAPIGVQPELPK